MKLKKIYIKETISPSSTRCAGGSWRKLITKQ